MGSETGMVLYILITYSYIWDLLDMVTIMRWSYQQSNVAAVVNVFIFNF